MSNFICKLLYNLRKLYIILFLLIAVYNANSQNDLASVSISGKTQKRIDKYTKTYKLRRKFDTQNLENVSIDIKTKKGKSIKKSKSDENGSYKVNFNVDPNSDYMLIFSKTGFYPKVFTFNTNGISNHKKIVFDDWDFHLYKRVIGLSDSIFNLPTKFYYDSERGYMTYDEGFNIPLEANQSEIYFEYLNNLNETDFVIQENPPISKSYSIDKTLKKEVKDTSVAIVKDTQQSLPEIKLIDIDELMNEIKVSKEEDKVFEDKKEEISNEWQKLEIAKVKATTKEDKDKILKAQQLLLAKEEQIQQAKAEIENAKRELEIKTLESKNKNILLGLSGSILLLVLSLLYVLYRNNKQRIRSNLLLQEKNKEVIDSIKYAQRLQNAILPPVAFINQKLENNFILYMPKDIVSGDFYWVEHFDNTTLFGVVDCTGHGVPGAFMSIVAYNALNQAVNQHKLRKPAEILNQVNIDISKTLHQSENIDVEDGMDISLCAFNSETKELSYAGAHHSLNLIKKRRIKNHKGR